MLARITKIEHPLGALIDLPRLVPAFSSKGFPFLKGSKTKSKSKADRKHRSKTAGKIEPVNQCKISETTVALELVGPFIKESILLSAYDLHHGHLRTPERFFREKELVFVDRGEYELSTSFDQT